MDQAGDRDHFDDASDPAIAAVIAALAPLRNDQIDRPDDVLARARQTIRRLDEA